MASQGRGSAEGSNSSSSGASRGFRRIASSSLRHHVNHVNISSTEELVSAANVAPEQQRKDFGEWLEKYVEWFVNKKAFVVNKDALMEYALLSKLNPEISEYKVLL